MHITLCLFDSLSVTYCCHLGHVFLVLIFHRLSLHFYTEGAGPEESRLLADDGVEKLPIENGDPDGIEATSPV